MRDIAAAPGSVARAGHPGQPWLEFPSAAIHRAGRLARPPSPMRPYLGSLAIAIFASSGLFPLPAAEPATLRHTTIGISGENFLINGRPTFPGRTWRGYSIEGLLPNARMVQGIFDDFNPATRARWAYPNTGQWDPERNTTEFIAAMPEWRRHGLLAFTLNLQGGSPEGYSKTQPWDNTALDPVGNLRPDYLRRLERILDRADELGMVVILGLYYFGQDHRLQDEAAVKNGVKHTVEWLLDRGYRNVLIEIDNECNGRYEHPILQAARVHELIGYAKSISRDGRRLLVSTSYTGGKIPSPAVAQAADFLLLHGNGVQTPDRITEMVRQTRAIEGYTPKPVVFNEDDHFDFERPQNNFIAATAAYASWGYFDYRFKGEGFDEGYQSVPVNWGISSERKRGFFTLLQEITGAAQP